MLAILGAWVAVVIVAAPTTSSNSEPTVAPMAYVEPDEPMDSTTTVPPSDRGRLTATTTPVRTASLAFTGDFLFHKRVNRLAAEAAATVDDRAYDYRRFLNPIRDLIAEVDWAACHMEVNLSADGRRRAPFPRFRAPGQIAFDAAELGFDSCTTASNHTLDHGEAGALETLDVLDAAGLHATGTARSAADDADRIRVEVNGIEIAHLAYTYWFNGLRLPDGSPWLSAEIDQKRILADAAAARAAGAEYVIVSLHWGDQYMNRPNRQQRELAPSLAGSSDIDLIIGHHAHVVQPIERIGATWVVYGLGNLLANYPQAIRRDELLVQVRLTERDDGFETRLTAVPLHVDRSSLKVYPASPTERPARLSGELNRALDASYARTVAIIESIGGVGSVAIR